MKPATGIFYHLFLAATCACLSAESSMGRRLKGLFRHSRDSSHGEDLRLVGGQADNEGRVEILHGGALTWGTVCDDLFDHKEAAVICNSLGYYGGSSHSSAYFGKGSGQIWLDNLECNGDEGTLADCVHNGWGNHDCDHAEDAGVTCYTEQQNFEDGEMRLVDGSSEHEGRVEIFHDGVWGTVCDDKFDDKEAIVVCNKLGYYGGKPKNFAHFGEGSGEIWLDDLYCIGNEDSLASCAPYVWGTDDCYHTEDAGVVCFTEQQELTEEGSMRLADGDDESEGRVEVYHDGEWGTVCSDMFNDLSASVVCRNLGFRFDHSNGNSFFGEGSGPIWMDDVLCNGNEPSLVECRRNPWGEHDCSHSEDISVKCSKDV